jgi:exodeoxyribonuclease VII small subunit
MARAKTAAAEGGQPDFDTSMKRLEEIVDQLEGGELTLEESIARYEEGITLSKRLEKVLDDAEKRIEKLVEKGGEVETEPFEAEDGNESGTLF